MPYPSDATATRRNASAAFVLLATFLVVAGLSQTARSQTYQVIHNFTGGSDGAQPAAGPTLDASGNLYGTSSVGGVVSPSCNYGGCGGVYRMTKHGSSWTFSPLYEFEGGEDGANPNSGTLAIGPDGALYGATFPLNQLPGTAFSVRPRPSPCGSLICPWLESTLHIFGQGDDGNYPIGGVIFDAAGNLYGTTFGGGTGNNNGTVWQATRSGQIWIENVIYNFPSNFAFGYGPEGTLTMDSEGNLYGTTQGGGDNGGGGVVYKLTHSASGWTNTILHSFQPNSLTEGWFLQGGVVLDAAGNIFGGTIFGGANNGGTVYELSPSGGGGYTINVLCSFTGIQGVGNSLTFDASGNLYGTTIRDGNNGNGFVFKLTQSNGQWTCNILHNFNGGIDGAISTGSVAIDAHGNVFGTATAGGTNNKGVVFEITQ